MMFKVLFSSDSLKSFVLFGLIGWILAVGPRADAHGGVHASIKRLTRAIREHPDSARLYLLRGQYYFIDEDMERAYTDYRTALDLKPNLYEANLLMGQVLIKRKKYSQALSHLNAYLRHRPKDTNAWVARAETYVQMNKISNALEDYLLAIRSSSHPKPDYFLRCSELTLREDPDNFKEAIAWLNIGKAHLNFNVVISKKIIDIALRTAHYDAAIEETEDVMKHLDRKEKWLYEMAEICQRKGDYDCAKNYSFQTLHAIEQLPLRLQKTHKIQRLKEQTQLLLQTIHSKNSIHHQD